MWLLQIASPSAEILVTPCHTKDSTLRFKIKDQIILSHEEFDFLDYNTAQEPVGEL